MSNQFDHVFDLYQSFSMFSLFLLFYLLFTHITREKDLRVYTFHAYTLADSPFA